MQIKRNELLSKHTTFRLGGEAKYFCEVKKIDELKECLEFCKEKRTPHFILGGGSNVVAYDSGYDGMVIKLKIEDYNLNGIYIEAGAGVSLSKIVDESLKNDLIGLEWAWGIPGTIGGAVRGNAGAYGGEMSDSVQSVMIFQEGQLVELENEDCKFKYRESVFKNSEDIIWVVKLKLRKGSEDELQLAKEKIEKIKKERNDKFSNGFSAGSFFKNIIMDENDIKKFKERFPELPDQFVGYKKIPAAWLIEQCDLKGFCIGDVCVSEKHAGIVLNKRKGNSDELAQLVSLIKTRVRDKFNLEMIEEVEYLN